MKREYWAGLFWVILLLSLPLFVGKQYILHMVIMSTIMSILAISWNLLSGYAGVFSFGHPVFFGLGSYASALLSMRAGLSPWVSIFVAGAFASVFSFLVALPTLRLSGAYVAVVTLAFMLILGQVCYNWTALTNGPMGLTGIPPFSKINVFGQVIDFGGISRVPYYYVIIIMFIATVYVIHLIVNSKLGLHLMAIRESEEAASAMGVKTTRNKIIAFVISSFFAGWVGGFYAHYILLLTPDVFGFYIMATILAATLIGGWGTKLGPALGAFILSFLTDFLKDLGDIHHFFYGSFLIVTIFFMPKGLISRLGKLFPR